MAGAERVQRDAEQVRGRIVDHLDPVPALPELQERLLHQLLRVGSIAGDEVESLEEPFVLLQEERVESGPPLDALLRERNDLTLCSHGPWTHGRHRALRSPEGATRSAAGQIVRPRSSSGTRSANVHAVQRSPAIRSHGRGMPWCSNQAPIRRTSRSRNACACRFFLGSTAWGKSIRTRSPSQTSTLYADRSPWTTSRYSMCSSASWTRDQIASSSTRSSTRYSCRRGAGMRRSPTYVIRIASSVRSIGLGTGAPTPASFSRVSHSRFTQRPPWTSRPNFVFWSSAARTRRSLMNSPSRYNPSSRKSRLVKGWYSFSATSCSPVVRGFARHRCTLASFPCFSGRSTSSISPSSKKCSNDSSCNGMLLRQIADRMEPRPAVWSRRRRSVRPQRRDAAM